MSSFRASQGQAVSANPSSATKAQDPVLLNAAGLYRRIRVDCMTAGQLVVLWFFAAPAALH
ncbi:hypothetical protein SIAM614_16227 [Stappia aggregata IAM 12614]|uniref:Uncharacterized protein n=1 Tax=Roseibium aggregatum (strain ATCC 25650 / DSM 13394 / JCM 20685 / NBRC 16684 / NCIMB 2208 / IAM 12614 / B1) TaxID=384765 RepID=A0NWJ2_ROSAI|nr:hypothetical protein SIAM614_16227 [Stappia aggregata IAM 12614] [Roseibium aggregatum IAM 12614]